MKVLGGDVSSQVMNEVIEHCQRLEVVQIECTSSNAQAVVRNNPKLRVFRVRFKVTIFEP